MLLFFLDVSDEHLGVGRNRNIWNLDEVYPLLIAVDFQIKVLVTTLFICAFFPLVHAQQMWSVVCVCAPDVQRCLGQSCDGAEVLLGGQESPCVRAVPFFACREQQFVGGERVSAR